MLAHWKSFAAINGTLIRIIRDTCVDPKMAAVKKINFEEAVLSGSSTNDNLGTTLFP